MTRRNASVHLSIRKRFDSWIRRIARLDMEAIGGAGRHYEKIRLSPVSSLAELCPPNWLKSYIPQRLIRVACVWKDELSRNVGAEGSNVYVWICENEILDSQVVCDFGSMLGFYKNIFDRFPQESGLGMDDARPKVVNPPLPFYAPKGKYDITWERGAHLEYRYSSLDELSAREIRKLEKTAIVSEASMNGRTEKSFGILKDFVWVGTLANL